MMCQTNFPVPLNYEDSSVSQDKKGSWSCKKWHRNASKHFALYSTQHCKRQYYNSVTHLPIEDADSQSYCYDNENHLLNSSDVITESQVKSRLDNIQSVIGKDSVGEDHQHLEYNKKSTNQFCKCLERQLHSKVSPLVIRSSCVCQYQCREVRYRKLLMMRLGRFRWSLGMELVLRSPSK